MQFQLPQHCDGVVTAARLLITARVLVTAQLLAAVEVVPLAASPAPVVVRRLGVGQVVGILGLHVVEAGSLVEVGGLGVQRRGVLAVEGLENLRGAALSAYTCDRVFQNKQTPLIFLTC
jgi:hypothetical protein